MANPYEKGYHGTNHNNGNMHEVNEKDPHAFVVFLVAFIGLMFFFFIG